MNQLGRREFLKMAGAAAGATAAAAATGGRVFASGNSNLPQQDATAEATPAAELAFWETMDVHHEEGVNIFLNNIGNDPTFWDNKMPFEMDGDTKVFNIVCQEIDWDTGGGMIFPAMAYNGTVPGPLVRVRVGDTVEVYLKNREDSWLMHNVDFHAATGPGGGAELTSCAPGEAKAFRFKAQNPGLYGGCHLSQARA